MQRLSRHRKRFLLQNALFSATANLLSKIWALFQVVYLIPMIYSFLRVLSLLCSETSKFKIQKNSCPPSFLKLYFSSTSSHLWFSDTALSFNSCLSIMRIDFAPSVSCSLFTPAYPVLVRIISGFLTLFPRLLSHTFSNETRKSCPSSCLLYTQVLLHVLWLEMIWWHPKITWMWSILIENFFFYLQFIDYRMTELSVIL